MRDKLIELINEFKELDFASPPDWWIEHFADHLLANGVTIPPCKVGDTVYEIVCDDPFLEDSSLSVIASTVCEFAIYTTEEMHNMNSVDKTFFLTREEAEKRLERLRGGEK